MMRGTYAAMDMIARDKEKQEKKADAYDDLKLDRDKLKAALQKLVDLKVYKEEFGKTAYYSEEQPLAWANARKVLKEIE